VTTPRPTRRGRRRARPGDRRLAGATAVVVIVLLVSMVRLVLQ
jgi:hypothetical protein